jgi:hypothetical protein
VKTNQLAEASRLTKKGNPQLGTKRKKKRGISQRMKKKEKRLTS